ncbi:MAG TPA: hypothetical protein VN828_14510 [Acidobacteriaceae bacterium]|nr:hypothetical protein [Acidobacteriaceae bacterium]
MQRAPYNQTRVFALALACALLSSAPPVYGQAPSTGSFPHPQEVPKDKDPLAILEIGAATSWNVAGGAATFAPNFAVETTPIENWLEIEAGVSPFFTRNATEWDTDLLFKKPWTLSRNVEFMLGVGPEWVHLRQNKATSDTIAAELAGDFMFWPGRKHRFGWFLEPSYDYAFAGGHQQSIGMSGGLLIAIK